jgi:hypothetical protein
MVAAYLIATVLAAGANAYAAAADFGRPNWIMVSMKRLGVSERWLTVLGSLKAAGALGVLAGIYVPAIGIAAAAGLILYFVAAIVTALRVRWYSHVPFPTVWLLLAVVSLALRLATA